MKKDNNRKECGLVAVEATIILPIAILSVILLLYLSLLMFQRANLQAGLETTLVYYKNTVTDTFVSKNETLSITKSDEGSVACGNSYSASLAQGPYDNLIGDGNNLGNEQAFEKYFRSVAGNMLFDDNLELTIDYNNFVILKQLEATATQVIELPIDFSILGVNNTFTITATAKVNVVDHEDTIRNLDYAIDIVEDTALGDFAKQFASKAAELYGKMKEFLEVEN